MHTVLFISLEVALLACCCLLAKALQFAAGCWRAHRQLLDSPIPGPKPASRVIGHVPQILGAKNAWVFSKWANTFGPLYKLHVLDHFMLVCTDPDSIMQLTRKGGHIPYMPKARVVYQALEIAVKPKQRNIVTTEDGLYWKAVRQGTAPCFSMSNLKKVVPLVVELTQRVSDHIAQEPGGLFDVSDAARRITSDIMGQMLLGEDLGGTRWEDCQYLDIFYHVLKAQAVLVTNPLYLWQLWRADARHARQCFTKHNSMMDDKVAALLKMPPPDYTIAAHLLRVIDPATGKPLEANKLKAEVAAFMAAGHETTSHAITWCLATLAVHPEVQQQVFDELTAAGLAHAGAGIFSGPGRPYDASDLGSLSLLSAVIKEGLRLLPPTPLGGVRVCVEDDTELCGYKVPKGTLVNIPSLPLALAQHTFGADALQFKPQRWMDSTAQTPSEPHRSRLSSTAAHPMGSDESDSEESDVQQQQDQYSSSRKVPAVSEGQQQSSGATAAGLGKGAEGQVPAQPDPLTFSTGVRDCLGQNLAKVELQVVLAMLLSRFKFSPGPDLQREAAVAAATGKPPITAVYALAEVHVTLQPAGGKMLLLAEPR